MTKKTLLDGRKRISELADGAAVAAKKQELLDLKSQEVPESAKPAASVQPEQVPLPLDQPDTPVSPTAATPVVISPQTHSAPTQVASDVDPASVKPEPAAPPVNVTVVPPAAPISAVKPVPPAPLKPAPVAKPSANPVQEGAAAAVKLQQLYTQLELAGDRHRYQYSAQVRHDTLVQEVKKMIEQKARQYQLQGLNETANLAHCQTFVDTVRQELARFNIKINSLRVKKPRG